MRRITVRASSCVIWSVTVRASSAGSANVRGPKRTFWMAFRTPKTKPCTHNCRLFGNGLLPETTCLSRKHKQVTAASALLRFELHRVHWGKEASSCWFFLVYWSTPAIKAYYYIKDTMVKAFIRRWCCHVGGNNFITLW